MSETFREIIVLVGPYLLALLTCLPSLVSWIKTFTSMKAIKRDLYDQKDLKEVKELLKAVVQENYEIKKANAELMSELTRVKRGAKNGKEKNV